MCALATAATLSSEFVGVECMVCMVAVFMVACDPSAVAFVSAFAAHATATALCACTADDDCVGTAPVSNGGGVCVRLAKPSD